VLSDRQVVELFHLHFIRALCAGPDRDAYAIKGGCNLRFFFESVRYSEDIDLDVSDRIPVHTLKEKVTRILAAPSLALPLRSRGIEVSAVTAPKQTDTTQRWKVGLVAGVAPLHTKIEFSRRVTDQVPTVEALAGNVLAEYQLMPLIAAHYSLGPAMRQKVHALEGRVKARDVFDLSVLFARSGGRVEELRSLRPILPKAIDTAMAVSYADYRSQVVSYLHPDYLGTYGTREAWDALQLQVVENLEKARVRHLGRGL